VVRSRRSRGYSSNSIGYERALEHIREAEALTRELGGTDKDVKEYFFSLPKRQQQEVLNKYGREHGASAREYAEITLPKWEMGTVRMSGMVAERLFNLLPPIMPIEEKFKLTESLWKHVGPSSNKTYYVGVDANLDEVSRQVTDYLEKVVINYEIPKAMESRFSWLSQGDIEVKQKLLNHFRNKDRHLLSEALRIQLPILLEHLRSEEGELTTHVAHVMKVEKHEVRIIVDKRVSGITEIAPKTPTQQDSSSWFWWVVGIIFVLWLIAK